MPNDYIQKVIELWSTAWIAMIGGLWHNLYLMRTGKQFTFILFLLNILLAGFVGYVVGKFIPYGGMHDGILAISWFSSFPILSIMEEKWADLVLKYLGIDMKKEDRRKTNLKK